MQVTIEEPLHNIRQACFQAALLYTSSKGTFGTFFPLLVGVKGKLAKYSAVPSVALSSCDAATLTIIQLYALKMLP